MAPSRPSPEPWPAQRDIQEQWVMWGADLDAPGLARLSLAQMVDDSMPGDPTGRDPIATLIRRLIHRPWVTVIALLTLASAAGLWGAGIHITSDMEALFPDDTPSVIRAQEAREALGSRTVLQIYIGSTNRDANRAFAATLADHLETQTDFFNEVEFRRDVSFFEQNALLFLPVEDLEEMADQVSETIKAAVARDMALDFDDEEEEAEDAEGEAKPRLPSEEELRANHGARDLAEYFETPDGEVLAVKAYPTFKPADIVRSKEMVARVRTITDALIATQPEHGFEVSFVGDYVRAGDTVGQITTDLGRSTGIALFIIACILSLYFRRIRAVALVLLPLIAGLAWTVAFARLALGQLNMITAFIFAILVGLGIDFAVHAVSRIDEARRGGRSLDEAVAPALSNLGRAMAAAAVTTIATFLSLTFFDFRGFSHFGWIAAAGVALCLVAVYTLVPALATGLERLWPRAPQVAPTPPTHAPGSSNHRRLAWGVLTVVCVVIAGAILGVPRVRFDGDMRKMRMERVEKRQDTPSLSKKYKREADNRSLSPGLVLTEDLEETEQAHRYLTRLTPKSRWLQGVFSVNTFVPEEQKDKAAIVAEIRRKVRNKYGILEGEDKADADRLLPYLDAKPFTVADLPEWVQAKFTDTQGRLGRYVLVYPKGVKSKAEDVLAIREALGELHVGEQVFHTTAPWMITGDMFATVRDEGPLTVGLAALVVLLLLLIDLRRPADVLMAFLPLVAGFALTLGILGWADIELNLFNVIVLPVVFGIGVDTAIHLVHRLRDGDSVGTVLRTTGAAAGVSALTTAVGFGSLLVISNPGLRSIGWVAIIGIGCSWLCTTSLIGAVATLRYGGHGAGEAGERA